MEPVSPLVKFSRVRTKNGTVTVVRDDLLRGGTKQRAAIPFLKSHLRTGVNEFVYASPFSGYAQVALAYSCKAVGTNCTLFAEQYNGEISEFTQLVSHFANVQLATNLMQAEIEAHQYAKLHPQCLKIPLGFNDPLFRDFLKAELAIQWEHLCSSLGFIPGKLWLPVGSGTLANTFRSIVPSGTTLKLVDVRVLSDQDDRIKKVASLPNSEYIKALELFHAPAEKAPPIPSNKYYDAKLWQYVRQQAGDNDVWWNVAG